MLRKRCLREATDEMARWDDMNLNRAIALNIAKLSQFESGVPAWEALATDRLLR